MNCCRASLNAFVAEATLSNAMPRFALHEGRTSDFDQSWKAQEMLGRHRWQNACRRHREQGRFLGLPIDGIPVVERAGVADRGLAARTVDDNESRIVLHDQPPAGDIGKILPAGGYPLGNTRHVIDLLDFLKSWTSARSAPVLIERGLPVEVFGIRVGPAGSREWPRSSRSRSRRKALVYVEHRCQVDDGNDFTNFFAC